MFNQPVKPRLFPLYYLVAFIGFPLVTAMVLYFLVPSTNLTIRYRGIFLLFSFYLLFNLWKNHTFLLGKKQFLVFVTFIMIYSFRIFYESFVNINENLRHSPERYFLFVFGVLLIPSIPFRKPLTITENKKCFLFFIVGLFLCMLYMSFYYRELFGTDFGRIQQDSFIGDSDAFGINPLIVGYLGSTLMSVSLVLIFIPSIVSKYSKALFAPLFIAGFLPFALGGSRGPVLSVIICFVCISTSQLSSGKAIKTCIYTLLLIGLFILSQNIAERLGSRTFTRFYNIYGAIESGSASASRIDSWKYVISRTNRSPIFGSGLERFGNHPHNAILEAYFSTGIIGGTLFVYLMFQGFKSSFFLFKISSEYSWISLLFIHDFVRHMFSAPLWTASTLIYSCFASIVSAEVIMLNKIKTV